MMSGVMKIGIALAMLFATRALAVTPSNVVQTTLGPIQGFVALDGVTKFLNVPFAAPPVGPLRFRSPQPNSGWSDTLQCTQPGNACINSEVTELLTCGWHLEHMDGDEDCLNLNIYLPPVSQSSALLPVMFWIYGGAFVSGNNWHGGDTNGGFDGSKLAKQHNVIIVATNYRLGAFGFMALDELRQEKGEHNSTGQYDVGFLLFSHRLFCPVFPLS